MDLRAELHRLIDDLLDRHEAGAADDATAEAPKNGDPAPPPPEAQETVNPNVPGGDVVRDAEGEPIIRPEPNSDAAAGVVQEGQGQPEPGAQP
jgi:hypothetical protein